jgi:propanediol dehydratase medium subunit
MQISHELLEQIVKEVVAGMNGGSVGKAGNGIQQSAANLGKGIKLAETGKSVRGTDPKEIVLVIPPAFGVNFKENISGLSNTDVLQQVMAGVEEEGLRLRVVRVYHSADVGALANLAAKLSGSGIGIGILSRGTTVITNKDLPPLSNLELFPLSPVLTLDSYRGIGRNAARYAKGENPVPVSAINDPLVLPHYSGLAALMHNKEAAFIDRSKAPQDLSVAFE